MGAVLIILLIGRADAMTTAVKVGNIMRVDTSRSKCVGECHPRMYVVMKVLWMGH